MIDKRGSTVNGVWERETGKSVTEPLRTCVFRREPILAQDPGFVSSGMKLPRKGGSFEDASRVPQGRSENTDSPRVSQTWLRTARTEVWPVHCSAGRICKARTEGLPGFRSLSTARCPPPAKSPRPSLHILPQAGLFCPLCWRRSPSHLDTRQPPEQPPGFRSCGPGGQVSLLLQTLSNPEKYHKAFPGSKRSASRTPSPLLPTVACQPRGSFFLAAKHSELIPASSRSCSLAQQAPPLLPAASLHLRFSWKVKTVLDSPTGRQTLLTPSERSLRRLS